MREVSRPSTRPHSLGNKYENDIAAAQTWNNARWYAENAVLRCETMHANAATLEPPGPLVCFIRDIFSAGDFAMDQRDLELLDKQMRAINRAPRRDGVVIVTVLMVFLAGMSLGHLLAGPGTEPTRVAVNDVTPVSPEGLPLVVHQ